MPPCHRTTPPGILCSLDLPFDPGSPEVWFVHPWGTGRSHSPRSCGAEGKGLGMCGACRRARVPGRPEGQGPGLWSCRWPAVGKHLPALPVAVQLSWPCHPSRPGSPLAPTASQGLHDPEGEEASRLLCWGWLIGVTAPAASPWPLPGRRLSWKRVVSPCSGSQPAVLGLTRVSELPLSPAL